MVKGKKCEVYESFNSDVVAYNGLIATDPQMNQQTDDWYVLVLVDGELRRVDTDKLKIIDA